MTQGNLANLYASLSDIVEEDRRVRQRQSIQAVVTALDSFERVGHAVYVAQAQRQALGLRSRFGNDVFDPLWNELGLGTLPDWLIQDAIGDSPGSSMPPELREILASLQDYQAALQAADRQQPDVVAWRAVADLGERLLAAQASAENLLDWDTVREQVASDYNTLGNAHDAAGDPETALAAFERAVALQPDFAMWRRNQAGMLIELRRLDDAAAAIEAARNLEPDAPRLAQLEAQLAAARTAPGDEVPRLQNDAR